MSWILEKLFGLKAGEWAGADQIRPSFNADYSNWVILGMAAAFIALVALTIRSYMRERGAGRRARGALAGLRIAVILIVFAMLCQPGVVLKYRKDVYSTVLVLLDDSLSMSLKDRYADAGIRTELAGKLGVTPEALGEMSRQEVVRAMLGRKDGPLAELTRDRKLMLVRFGAAEGAYTQRIMDLDVLDDDEKRAGISEKISAELKTALVAGGRQTNLARALREGAGKVPGRRVAGIVIVSDGQDTADWAYESIDPLRAVLAKLEKRGIPVYAVCVGDPEKRRNVRITRLQSPAIIRKGADIELTAYVSATGETDVNLKLFRRPTGAEKWTDTGVTKTVRLTGAADDKAPDEQKVALRHAAHDLGEFEYRVRAEPIEAEVDLADNEATTRVRVTDEKLKILLISAEGGWEFQYLRNLLLRNPERYAVSVWQQNADKEFNQEASTGMRLSRLPRDKKDLFKYELVILYDPAYTKDGFDGQFVTMLEDFVGNHHGGLCYIASNKHSDENLIGGGPFQPLANVLPVVLDRRQIDIAERISRSVPVAWPVIPTAVGLDHPLLRFDGDTSVNLRVWQSLPGVYWSHPVYKLKPLGTALAVSSDPRNRQTGSSEAGANPVIAMQYYGKGRSVYVGSDETWRWRFIRDGRLHRQFWYNMVDFLSSGKLQQQRVVITTGADRFTVGETMRVRVEAYGKDYLPLTDPKFVVEMIPRDDGKAVSIELEPASKGKGDGRYEAEVKLKTLGTFELTAKRDDPSYENLVSGKTIIVGLPEQERRHPESNPQRLQTLAPGERFLWIRQADQLPQRVPNRNLTVFEEVPRDLWDVPAAVVLVVALLAAEWIIRKKYNMT